MIEISDTIWKVHKNLRPLHLLFGCWVYDTWWKRFRGFLRTGSWPKKQYIEGLIDKLKGDTKINWIE